MLKQIVANTLNEEDPPQMKRFVLHGIAGVYNYGCEAIVRGTVEILRTHFPDCAIAYASKRPAEDGEALRDISIEIIDDRPLCRWHPRRVVGGLLWRLKIPSAWFPQERLDWLTPADCVISIGGDIFTLGTGPFPRKFPREQLRLPHRIIARRIPFVLWGASVGPFEAWPAAVPHYRRFLNTVSLITVRESATRRYLAQLGVNSRIVEVADPAFLMSAEVENSDWPFPDRAEPTVGVNLSPLSVGYRFGWSHLEWAAAAQAGFLEQLQKRLAVRVLLIPHVFAPHPEDDDHAYLRRILTHVGKPQANSVALLPPGLGARRTKGVISRCDLLIAVRMHCGIAGVSSGVPTIFLGYSQKAAAMATYVYGNKRNYLPLDQLTTPEGVARIAQVFSDRHEQRSWLIRRESRFRTDALAAGVALKKTFAKAKR